MEAIHDVNAADVAASFDRDKVYAKLGKAQLCAIWKDAKPIIIALEAGAKNIFLRIGLELVIAFCDGECGKAARN